MSDYLGRLAQRAVAPHTLLQPRVRARYEPGGFEEIENETTAPRKAAAEPSNGKPPEQMQQSSRSHGEAAPPREEARKAVETHVSELPPRIEMRERVVTRELPTPASVVLPVDAPAAPESGETTVAPERERVVEREHVVTVARTETRVVRGDDEATPLRPTPAPLPHDDAVPAGAERDIHITIGRIDVRAVTQPQRTPAAAKRPPALTLDEYLAKRSGR